MGRGRKARHGSSRSRRQYEWEDLTAGQVEALLDAGLRQAMVDHCPLCNGEGEGSTTDGAAAVTVFEVDITNDPRLWSEGRSATAPVHGRRDRNDDHGRA